MYPVCYRVYNRQINKSEFIVITAIDSLNNPNYLYYKFYHL